MAARGTATAVLYEPGRQSHRLQPQLMVREHAVSMIAKAVGKRVFIDTSSGNVGIG